MPFALSTQTTAYDPNWFLSTIAQSTAALVAIIGGLLISRLVSMVSEKSSNLHRLAELEKRKQISTNALGDVQSAIQRRTNEWFLTEQLTRFVKAKGQVDITEIVENFQAIGSEEDLTMLFAQALADAVVRAFEEITEAYPGMAIPPSDSTELQKAGLYINSPTEEVIYERVASEIASKRKLEDLLASLRSNEVEPETPRVLSNTLIQRHDAQISKKTDLNTSISFIDSEISLIKSKLPSLTNPNRLIWGFLVLAFFGATGILYPLYLMTKNPVIAFSMTRTEVFVGFLSGFIALLAYIMTTFQELRNPLDDDDSE